MVYYNEIDPYAAQWLRNLIAAGHIAEGDVDTRSIKDVRADDLRPYVQCHFFAGVGVWSHALRLAGWPDDRPVWTGSCPCQPFSAAGKGAGFADERHLWPEFYRLIAECRPPVVFGEQVASKDGLGWLNLVQADLERSGYATGAADLCAAGVGAPHIRQRLWWVGHTYGSRSAPRISKTLERQEGNATQPDDGMRGLLGSDTRQSLPCGLAAADSASKGMVGNCGVSLGSGGTRDARAGLGGSSSHGGLADAEHDGHCGSKSYSPQSNSDKQNFGLSDGRHFALEGQPATSPTNGFWGSADWLYCRDGKWRPVEPGTFPLAYGAAARVGRLRAYGNAIVPQVAQAFIEAYLDAVA